MSVRDCALVVAGASAMGGFARWMAGDQVLALVDAAIFLIAAVSVGVMDGMRDRRRAG